MTARPSVLLIAAFVLAAAGLFAAASAPMLHLAAAVVA